jgi:hypothetical protein
MFEYAQVRVKIWGLKSIVEPKTTNSSFKLESILLIKSIQLENIQTYQYQFYTSRINFGIWIHNVFDGIKMTLWFSWSSKV